MVGNLEMDWTSRDVARSRYPGLYGCLLHLEVDLPRVGTHGVDTVVRDNVGNC